MKAVVHHDVGAIGLDDVPEPTIQDPGDALVRTRGAGICGTMPGMEEGTILGHEAVGVDAMHPHSPPATAISDQQKTAISSRTCGPSGW